MSEPVRPRYSTRPFPPYSYVPGSGTPHPVSNAQGHMYGVREELQSPLDPAKWQASETYLYAIDLFNHGYYWEAHEAWEALWHAAGHRGQVADFLKGLIKLAAAGVKFREGNPAGVRRHLQRGQELLRSVNKKQFAGLDIESIIAQTDELNSDANANSPLSLALGPPLP
jgi:uncharacterized protein